jgi:farnesyl-diphosphate farnesyltransferase
MAHATNELLTSLLKSVSRSFYSTLRILPPAIRPQIGLAYLLARMTDTVADSDIVPLDQRLRGLRALRDRILGTSVSALDFGELVRRQGSPAERALLEKCETSLTLLESFPATDQKLIREVLATITSGQELDLRRFATASNRQIVALRTDEELDDYTYRVAGCVGKFWTAMCVEHQFADLEILGESVLTSPHFEQLGIRFGKGLQLVNILRDVPEDLRKGRCYLPETKLRDRSVRPGTRTEVSPALPSLPRPRRVASDRRLGIHEPDSVRPGTAAPRLRLADPHRAGNDPAPAPHQRPPSAAARQNQPQ